MGLTDTSEVLLSGMRAALSAWSSHLDDSGDQLHWLLQLTLAQTGLGGDSTVADVTEGIPEAARKEVLAQFHMALDYWDDIRYAALEPVTQLWGTIVNGLRVSAGSDRASDTQKRVFEFSDDSLLAFLRAARERMEVADHLYHAFKAMPAPECQALAALLNVHVDMPLDSESMRRLVRLLDHEGPMSEEEREYLASLQKTHLVNAAFRGLRGCA